MLSKAKVSSDFYIYMFVWLLRQGDLENNILGRPGTFTKIKLAWNLLPSSCLCLSSSKRPLHPDIITFLLDLKIGSPMYIRGMSSKL